MGVKYLTTFIDKFHDLRKSTKLKNTKLVIDGNNILHALCAQYSVFHPEETLYGGNYTNFEKFFQIFFKTLKNAKITPIFVFDGGINSDLIETRKLRFEEIFSASLNVSDGRFITSDKHIYPTLIRVVFNHVINQFNIQSFQTWTDADLETAKLANHLKCPVLTDDSDFLIMNIEFGVISFRDFNWLESSSDYSIQCKRYNVRDFVQIYNGLSLEMLPIFASLLVNDFNITEDIFFSLFKDMGFTPIYNVVNGVKIYNNFHSKNLLMDKILIWLSKSFTNAVHAIHYILTFLHKKYQNSYQKLEMVFKKSVNSYDINLKPCYLNQLIGLHTSTLVEDLTTDLLIFQRKPYLPKQFVLEYHLNKKYNIFVDFIETKFLFLRPKIEDFSLNSVYRSSEDLLSIICSITRLNRNETNSVDLVTRIGREITEITITSEDYLHKQEVIEDLPLFGNIDSISPEKKLQLLLKILGSIEMMSEMRETLGLLSITKPEIDFWVYFLVVVNYWLRKSSITMPFPMVYSLVVSVIHNKYRYLESRDIRLLFDRMTDTIVEINRFDIRLVHYYSEFQTVLQLIDKLNSLFSEPFDTNLSLLSVNLNSILINNLCHKVLNHGFHLFSNQRLDSFFWIIYSLIK